MSIATGSQHSFHITPEAVYGETPANPVWEPVPITGVNLKITKDAIESGKLRTDRQVEDLRHGNDKVDGDVNAELEHASFDTLIEAALLGNTVGGLVSAGVTRRSFSGERRFVLETDEYHRYTGLEVNTFSLSAKPNSMVECTFGFIGKGLSVSTSQVSGSTYSDDLDSKPFDSFSGEVREGGSASGIITQVDLSLSNGLEPAYVIGSKQTIRPSVGKSRLTGTATAFYESSALYQKFLSEAESVLYLRLEDPQGNDIEISIPRLKYTSGAPDVGGDGSVTLALQFTALYDSVLDSQISIQVNEA